MKKIALCCRLVLQYSLLFAVSASAMQPIDVPDAERHTVLAGNPFIKAEPTGYYGMHDSVCCTKLQSVTSGDVVAYVGLLSDRTAFVKLQVDAETQFYFSTSYNSARRLQLAVAEGKQKSEPHFFSGKQTFNRCTITQAEELTVTLYNHGQRGSTTELTEIGLSAIKQPYSHNPTLAALLFAWEAAVAMLEQESIDTD